jgi:hypothetical protein
LFIGAYPFVESIYRYERDLSGKQAYLELMIPAVGWMKVLSKLIATMVGLVICGTLSLLSMFMYFMVNSNFRYLTELLKFFMEKYTERRSENGSDDFVYAVQLRGDLHDDILLYLRCKILYA